MISTVFIIEKPLLSEDSCTGFELLFINTNANQQRSFAFRSILKSCLHFIHACFVCESRIQRIERQITSNFKMFPNLIIGDTKLTLFSSTNDETLVCLYFFVIICIRQNVLIFVERMQINNNLLAPQMDLCIFNYSFCGSF